MADKKSKDEGTPPKQKFNYTASSSLSVANSNSGAGFFSLGESNIAERAKQLKIERRATMEHAKQQIEKKERRASMQHKNNVGNGENGVHDTANESKGKNDSEKKTVNEFDSLLISNQVNEIDNVLYKSLAEGFQRFREQRRIASSSSSSVDGGGAVPSDKPKYFATVNFIDPTTKAESSSESSSSNSPKSKVKNMLQQQKGMLKKIGGSSKSISASLTVENVYENLTYIFERDYGSVLRSVQYKSVRTGETNFISKLPVRPVITRNGSTVDSTEASTPDNPNTPWGGAALTAMTPVSDPSEWHTGPFCHVYIAACENLDHYKDKIRPALRAFTTQLESTASNTTANQQGGHSADYMIVYVPVGDGRNISYQRKPATPTANKTNNNTGRMGLLGMARQRFGGGSMSEHGRNDDAISKNSIDSGDDAFFINGDPNADGDGDESCPINVLSALQHLSKTERSLYKKIVTDFPNGKVSVLSTGSLDRSPPSEEGLSIMVQEWHVFNRMLGTVVVNGFQDRIRRYTNELKRLDAQRATAATAAKNYESGGAMSSKPQKPNPYAFNLSHFFLVKESLASSYEQMQLPGEALLQYDEFRLYMPDLTDKEESKVRHARRLSKALMEDESSQNLAELADAGDFLGFRKKIKSEYDLTAILDVMRRYLFARELSLLFRMQDPVELLLRCQSFIKVMYSILVRGVSELDEKEHHERMSRAASWVVQFSWDIYSATSQFLNCQPQKSSERRNTLTDNRAEKERDEKVAAKLSEILEVSRLFLIELGDDHFGNSEEFSVRPKHLPKDLGQPWPPWVPCEDEAEREAKQPALGLEQNPFFGTGTLERQFLLPSNDQMNSLDDFGETYLKLCRAIIDTSHIAKHFRLSARIQSEIGEYYVRKGDFHSASASFQKIVKVYRIDHWDRAHFWRIFRLAYCQRTTVEATAYLKTLCSCFSPRSKSVAPKKALIALFDDLLRVIEHPSIGNARYSRLLFIETSLSISTASESSKMGKMLDQKRVEKRSCSVGEKILIPITIRSHLPGSIQLTSVKLFTLTVDDFTAIITNGDAVQEEDAAKVLSIDVPIELNPGENKFSFEWSPTSAGHYILSTIELVWKQGYFYYDSMDLQEPMLSVDVLPSKPTHSISIEPSTLVPGQDQEIQVVFEAGTDFVNSAKLFVSGTDGILLIPPGEDPSTSEWRQDWEIDLKPCQPGERLTMTTHVRCGTGFMSQVDSMNSNHGLVAKAETSYLHSHTKESDESNQESTKTTLESFAPVQDKTALSIESIETYWLHAKDRFLLSITVTSNTPYLSTVKEWGLEMASPIAEATGTDLNENVLEQTVSDGDRLSFAFECTVEKGLSMEPQKSSKLHLKLYADTEKEYSLALPLDLDEFYSSLSQEDSSNAADIPFALELEKSHGLVGEPVEMKFVADPGGSYDMEGVRFVYSIDCGTSDWLVGGKVNGIIELSRSTVLSCVGIPVVSGMLDRFPTIALERLEASHEKSTSSTLFGVDCHLPDAFRSLPMTEVNGVASPRT